MQELGILSHIRQAMLSLIFFISYQKLVTCFGKRKQVKCYHLGYKVLVMSLFGFI